MLYGEHYEEVVQGIAGFLRMLLAQGADKIILVCGTAHYFLEDVYKIIPQAQEKIIDIINVLGEKMEEKRR